MRWSARRKKIEPGRPGGVGICGRVPVAVSGTDSSNGTPEDVAIFAIPAGNQGIRHGYVQEAEQVRVLCKRQRPFGGNLHGNSVPIERGVPGPEQYELRLVRGA